MNRVALIEDDPEQGALYAAALTRGYHVRVLSHGVGSTNELIAFRPHAVVIDVRLAGIQGPDLLKIYQRHLPAETYYVLHSALDPDRLRMLARSCNCDWCPKDGEANGLMRKLDKHFSRVTESR